MKQQQQHSLIKFVLPIAILGAAIGICSGQTLNSPLAIPTSTIDDIVKVINDLGGNVSFKSIMNVMTGIFFVGRIGRKYIPESMLHSKVITVLDHMAMNLQSPPTPPVVVGGVSEQKNTTETAAK